MSRRKDDIERYLKGEMSPGEMYALEKEALRDPFLSEALEGINQADSETFLFDLKELHNTVHQRTKARSRKPKFISMWNWSIGIAAGLILMAVSSVYVIVNLPKQRESQALSLNENSVSQVEEQPILTDSLVQDNEAKPDQRLSLSTAPEKSETFSEKRSVSPVSPSQPLTDHVTRAGEGETLSAEPEPLAKSEVNERDDRSGAEEIYTDPSEGIAESKKEAPRTSNTPILAARDTVHAESAKEFIGTTNVVQGKVISTEDGAALMGVNVVVKGSSIGTITDVEGNYKIPLSDVKQNLVFSFIGMKPVEVTPGTKAELDVKMSPDFSQLSEVIVTGYSTGTRIEGDFPTWEFAEPEGGKRAFQKYLEEKMSYPEKALESGVEGAITVQFMVGSDGTLEDFKVLKGLGYGCDDEVIRLIKEGPAWSPSKRNAQPVPDKVKVRLKFDISNKQKQK